MFIVILETTNFVFHAAGAAEDAARRALDEGLVQHARETGADLGYLREIAGEANVLDLAPGDCFRDYTRIA